MGRYSSHEGYDPLPKKSVLLEIAERAYNEVWDAVLELAREKGVDVKELEIYQVPFRKQPKEVRDRWLADITNIKLGGRSFHPDPFAQKIILQTVRND